MFGLDARIALAIFGALSVISGAALYSAIQQSKVISIVSTLNEYQKAYESYLLDVGYHIQEDSSSTVEIEIEELVTSTKAGWAGPYISEEVSAHQVSLSDYGNIAFRTYTNIDWGIKLSDNTQISPVDCTGGDAGCKVYIGWHNIPLDIAKAVDTYIDGTSDGQKGKVKLYNPAATYKHVWLDTGITYK